MKTLLDEITSLDWDIVPADDFEYDWVQEAIKEVKAFFDRPNKNGQSFQSIMRAFIKDVLEIDAGVLVKVFDIGSYDFNEIEPKSGAPMLKPFGQRHMTELYAMDGASFLKEIDKFSFCKGYWQYSYQIPAHPMWFNFDEIIYASEQPRSMSCYGYSRVQGILDVVKSLHYSTLYNKKFFEETAIPDGALSLLDTNEPEMKDFMNYWQNEFKAQPHKVLVMNKDMKWQPFVSTNRDLEFLDTQKWYMNLVISNFGLSPSELGITEDLNRATSATQSELVKRKGIRPFLKLFENFINKGLIPEFGYEGIQFQFIYDDPAEKKAKLDNWKLELDMGIKTPNEIREELGLEPIEGGDLSQNFASRVQGMIAGSQKIPGIPVKEEMPGIPVKEENEMSSEEQAQAPGYVEERDRNEAEEFKERQREVHNPYSSNNRPVGGFKSAPDPGKPANGGFIAQPQNKPVSDERKRDLAFGAHLGTYDSGQVKIGMEEESDEHPELSEELRMQLVLDHLSEDPEYYTHMDRLSEKGAEGLNLSSEQFRELMGKIERGLGDDVYRILVSTGMDSHRAAMYAQGLKNRGRMKNKDSNFGKPGLGHSDHWWSVYHALIREGHSKESAAKIANSQEAKKGISMPGQYYAEPQQVNRKPRDNVFQPINDKKPMQSYDNRLPNNWDSSRQSYNDTDPSHLGDTYSDPSRHDWKHDTIHCPMCGAPTLTYLAALEELPDDLRCTQCGSRFKMDDLMMAPFMEEMHNTLQHYNQSNPVSIPEWSPKSFHKGWDDDLDLKEYCNFDVGKAYAHAINYANSEEYRALMKKYLGDLSLENREKIISIIKNSLRSGESIGKIAKKIEMLIGDVERSRLIARTEVIRVSNEGNLDRMEERGYKKAEFIASPEDGRRCEICAKLDGKIFTIKEAHNTIPLHPRCRCAYAEHHQN